MSVLNINANNLKIIDNTGMKDGIDYSFFVNEGDVIEGRVAENNKVIIDMYGEKITVDNSDAGQSQVGDVKQYQVMDSGKNKLVLQEMQNTGINEKIDINERINSKEMQHSYETQEIKKSLAESNESILNNEKEQELTDKLDKSVIVMSPEDVRAIEAEGKDIEDMDIEEIYNKVSKLKREKTETEYKTCGNVDKNVDNLANWNGNTLESVDNSDNSNVDNDIVRKNTHKLGIIIENTDFKAKVNDKIQLKYFDEPDTSSAEIPEELSHVIEELYDNNEKGCMSKDAIKYIMQNELDHTLDNIYKAKYAGTKIVTHNIADDDFEQLLDQVKDVIINSGYEVNEENIDIAKWIIECDIPLTEETFTEYFDLNKLNNYTKEDLNTIVNDYLEDDVAIEDMIISYVDINEVKDVVNNVDIITDEAIETAINENKVINLSNLLSTQRSIDAQLINNPNVTEKVEEKPSNIKYLNLDKIMNNLEEREQQKIVEGQTITARRQLEEIRLKLSLEAGNKLALKGFNIATEELSVVVEELRNIEQAYNNNYPIELKDNYDGQKLYDETNEKVADVKEMSGYILAATYVNRDKITIEGLYEEGTKDTYRAYNEVNFKVSRNIDKFNKTHETIMTMPRKDMGDSIEKAFRNVDEILEDLDIEVTELNQRAVRILGYNNTEITKENIAAVKLFDYEVNKVLDEITPAVTVELIKRDKNPLNMTLEELGQEIAEIKASNIDETNDSYSKYLWRLDRQSKLSSKERDAYIGIYRLIHQVEKSDGAVIGAIMNSGKELTLKNLLTEARVRQNKGINVNIDDLFGAIESVTRTDKAIDTQIGAAFVQNELKLNKKIFNDIAEKITPMIMSEATTEKVDIMNMPIEQLLQYIEEQKEKDEEVDEKYYEYKVSTINQIADNTNEAVKLINRLGLETTINNIIAASEVIAGNSTASIIKKLIKKNEKDSELWTEDGSVETIADIKQSLLSKASNIIEVIDERDKLNYAYTEIESDIKTLVNAYKENYQDSELDIEELRSINRNITFATHMGRRECYEIPLITGENEDNINITNVNLTIIRNSNKHEVSINLNSELLGRIEANFIYKDNVVKGLILGNNVAGIEMLKNNYNNLKQSIVAEDINLKQLDYGINNRINYTFAGKDNNATETEISTKKLYSLSKALIMNIKETEEQILAQS